MIHTAMHIQPTMACLPLVAVAAISIAATVASAAVSAVASKNQADYQAKMAGNQAKVAGYQAQNADLQGRMQQDQINRRTAAEIGSQDADFGSSGISLGSGTSEQVAVDTRGFGAADIATTQYNTALAKWGFKTQQNVDLSMQSMYGAAASNATTAGAVNGAASVLSSVTMFNAQGAFNMGNPSGFGTFSNGTPMGTIGNFGNFGGQG